MVPPVPVPAPEGVIYSSTGDFYVAEAIRSLRSSLRHNALPHLLFSAGEVDPAEGLSVARFEPSGNPYVDKIANMRRSPFERTLYLDSDTYVVDEIAHVLRLLDRYDMAVAFAPAYRGLEDPAVPRAFHEFNTGVLAWRASERMSAFMADWQDTYERWLHEEPFPGAGKASRSRRADQPAFRRCAWEHEVSLFVLTPEYNFRLGYPATVVDRVRVIHGEHPDPEGLAARLNARERPRSWPPPLGFREKVARRYARRRALRRHRRARHAPSRTTTHRDGSRRDRRRGRVGAARGAEGCARIGQDRAGLLRRRSRQVRYDGAACDARWAPADLPAVPARDAVPRAWGGRSRAAPGGGTGATPTDTRRLSLAVRAGAQRTAGGRDLHGLPEDARDGTPDCRDAPGCTHRRILPRAASFVRSLHLQLLQAGIETERDLARALALEPGRVRGRVPQAGVLWTDALLYTRQIGYTEQLRSYHECFGTDRVLALIYEDFRADNDAVVRQVLRFLDVEDSVEIQQSEANPTVLVRSRRAEGLLHSVTVGRRPAARAVGSAVKAVTPAPLRHRALRAIRRTVVDNSPPPADERLVRELRQRFRGEVLAFGEYLGRDLAGFWGYEAAE